MELMQTDRTYKTRENALKALTATLAKAGLTLDNARWLVAATADGRFAPVLVGAPYIPFAHHGITVVG